MFSTCSVRTVPFPMYLWGEVNSTCYYCTIVTPHPSYLFYSSFSIEEVEWLMFFTIKHRGRGERGIFFDGKAVGLIEVTFLSLMFLWVWGDAVDFLLARGKKGHPIKKCF